MNLEQMKCLPPEEQVKLFKKLDEIRAAGKSTNYACLPIDNTEVLTPHGWQAGDKIVVGDVVMGYNSETKENQWCEVLNTHLYKNAYVEEWGHTNWKVESTLDHRWVGQVLKQVGPTKGEHKKFWVDCEVTTSQFKQTFNILNTAPYAGGGSLVKPHEAALVAWLLSDGYYKWSELSETTSSSAGKKKGIVASIAQASHKFQEEIRDVLRQNSIHFEEDSLNSLNENTVTSFRLKSSDIREFLDRVVGSRLQKHEVDWVSWVLKLRNESLVAFVYNFWLADGDTKKNVNKKYMTIKQNRGKIADAVLLAGYLLGFNVTHRGSDKISTIRFQKKRRHTTCQEFKMLSSRTTDVFCLTTELDTFVIKQNGVITITGNCQYGAGVKTVARTAKVSDAIAKKLHEGYHKLNWSIAKIASMMVVKKTDFGDWQINPINKMWYSLRSDKDRFSTLIQGTGAYILDLWLYHGERLAKQRGLDWTLVGQFHDELILEIPVGEEDVYKQLVADALDKVNQQLKLNRELACDIKFGDRYSDIH